MFILLCKGHVWFIRNGGDVMKFNRSQILGLDIDRHIVLDAGAGTGKTTVMAERYVQHLLSRIQRSTLVLPNATMDTDSLSNN